MQCVLRCTKHCVLSSDNIPAKFMKPWKVCRQELLRFRFLLSFNSLEFINACTLQKSLTSLCINWFSGEAFLHRQALCHQFAKEQIIQKLRINRLIHAQIICQIDLARNRLFLRNGRWNWPIGIAVFRTVFVVETARFMTLRSNHDKMGLTLVFHLDHFGSFRRHGQTRRVLC